MGDLVKHILVKPIQLSDQVIKAADEAASFKHDCSELKSKTEKLAGLLRQAARARHELYDRPTRRIIEATNQALEKSLALALKCRGSGSVLKRVFTIVPANSFRKVSSQLENSAGDLSWLLRVSAGGEHLGLPPIAANEPILGFIWEQIAILHKGSVDDRSDAAAALVSLARDNRRYVRLIVEEGGVVPLLKLVKEGKPEGQENAARAIGLLGREEENVEEMVRAGVCSAFAKILKEGPMKVQSVVCWAVSELAAHYPKCQDLFAQHKIIRLLVGHLAFETVQEHSKYKVAKKANSMHATAVMAIKINHHHQHRESDDPSVKAHLKSTSALALRHLAKGNTSICRTITESRALLCFAVLLEKGPEEVQFNSAMALMEITAVAEENPDLRRYAFKPNSPACKSVIDQLFNLVEKASDSKILIPCVKSIGNLSRTFRASEKRFIPPLVKLLEEREDEVCTEACVALAKFASLDNFLHLDHSKAIVGSGGARHLVQLVYFGERIVQKSALILLCYVAVNVPDSDELTRAEVLTVLEWAAKQSFLLVQDEGLLLEAKGKLELYQSRGYHTVKY